MNPSENSISQLQFTLVEVSRHIWKHLKIDPEVVIKCFKAEYNTNLCDLVPENGVSTFYCYENGQMKDLEEFIESVICFNSIGIDIDQVRIKVLQFTISLLEIRKEENNNIKIKCKREKRCSFDLNYRLCFYDTGFYLLNICSYEYSFEYCSYTSICDYQWAILCILYNL